MTKSSFRPTTLTATRISPTQWRSSLKWTEYRRKVRRRFCGITARGYMGSMDDKRILDFGFKGEGNETKIFETSSKLFFRQSKTCGEQRQTIGNPKPVLSYVEVSKMGGVSSPRSRICSVWGRGRGAATGKSLPHRFPGWKHCFWYGGARRCVSARAEPTWLDGRKKYHHRVSIWRAKK